MIDDAILFARRKQKSIDDFKFIAAMKELIKLIHDEEIYMIFRSSIEYATQTHKINYKDVESK